MKRSTKVPKPRKGAWFVPVRGSYLPASWQAWLLYVPYVYYLVATLWMVVHSSESLTAMAINLVPYWVAGVAVMTWIAKQKS
ncbi:MAG TPA: hypothetical protein VL362_00515 [Patescibacteria group bacterium]|jgi:hypothetical protein|nr:hypothetical protein [Patescibacteria group bacterium]